MTGEAAAGGASWTKISLPLQCKAPVGFEYPTGVLHCKGEFEKSDSSGVL